MAAGFKARSDVHEAMGYDPQCRLLAALPFESTYEPMARTGEVDARIPADRARERRLGLSFPLSGGGRGAHASSSTDQTPDGEEDTHDP